MGNGRVFTAPGVGVGADMPTMDEIMTEIARRLRAYNGYDHAWGGPGQWVRREAVFETIAKAITQPQTEGNHNG